MKNNKFPYRKILIVGCCGAGKSTLAVKLGERFFLPVIHLDKLLWLPNWQKREREEFDILLNEQLLKDTFIIDDNYCRTFAHRLEYADFCVFLDYSKDLCLNSAYERVKKYEGQTRPDMATGCVERKVDSEFEEFISSYQNNVKPEMMNILTKSKVPYKIFKTREETESWLNSFN